MSPTPAASAIRQAIGIDIDQPFQRVLAAWLVERSYQVSFAPLALAAGSGGKVELVVCELMEPKAHGAQILRRMADAHPGALLLAISARFVACARGDALAHQLGADAALAKPFSRDDLHAALDAALAGRGRRRHGCT